eukprot:CAMPEP_0172605086 /NCGR_PEP_ID=MMETSP1068-20121228/25319_1 /TAXON_ID=35684 /ORGANISM="Pseudopedinella elastica, Strain CCMP716" /LENGTH=277 /DNA_ID=CAMNT_0013407365 /DNA_START=418 /DNA_END=1251 /DNA_ORIENTATION=+
MNPSVSGNIRHTDARKAAFLAAAVRHEDQAALRPPPLQPAPTLTGVPQDAAVPHTKTFAFKRAYETSSSFGKSAALHDASRRARELQARHQEQAATAPRHVGTLSSSPGFSAFRFRSGPETTSSMRLGAHQSLPGQPSFLSLREQRKWGGASMAGHAFRHLGPAGALIAGTSAHFEDSARAEASSATFDAAAAAPGRHSSKKQARAKLDHTKRVAAAEPRHQKFTAEAVAALPSLAAHDAKASVLLEDSAALQARRTELASQLRGVNQALASHACPK